ncbi:MAG: hypothetical protein KatS3mg082_0818 [Nitrospiraceae bacterium]|nr:MAG: hypothetical protein KatS3mg082_0818 [Nitrospiraceae bacterium]
MSKLFGTLAHRGRVRKPTIRAPIAPRLPWVPAYAGMLAAQSFDALFHVRLSLSRLCLGGHPLLFLLQWVQRDATPGYPLLVHRNGWNRRTVMNNAGQRG